MCDGGGGAGRQTRCTGWLQAGSSRVTERGPRSRLKPETAGPGRTPIRSTLPQRSPVHATHTDPWGTIGWVRGSDAPKSSCSEHRGNIAYKACAPSQGAYLRRYPHPLLHWGAEGRPQARTLVMYTLVPTVIFNGSRSTKQYSSDSTTARCTWLQARQGTIRHGKALRTAHCSTWSARLCC